MALILVTAPTVEPVTLSEAKSHCRVDHDHEDALLSLYLAAARNAAEVETGRQICTATWKLMLDEFPDCDTIELTKAPFQSVTHVKYYDVNGVLQTFTDYKTSLGGLRGRVVLDYGESWPVADYRPDAVIVTYVAGYGGAADVPAGLKTAILLLAAHWYEHREAVIHGTIVAEMPRSFKYLLQNFNVGKV